MRLAGVPNVVRFRGVVARHMYGPLGALPENLQNELYPVGYPNSNYNDVINNSTWDLMRTAMSRGYPELPYAGAGVQNPWFTSAGPGFAFSTSGTMVKESGEALPAPAPGTVTGGGGGAAKGRGKVAMAGLSGLGEILPLTAAFPYMIKAPFITGNNFWYTGQPTLNIGAPRFYNDAEEFLRSALVDSDWDRVEAWLGWALQNGMTRDKLTMFDFGRYKYTGSGATKKFYPFSKADIRSFYERFLKFTAVSSPADRSCIQAKYEMAMKAANSSPRNQFVLRLSDCPLTEGWEKALLKMVAIVAIPVAIAAVATIAVGAAGAAAAGGGAAGAGAAGAGAAGTAGAAGAGAAGAAAVIPAGVEVVTVAATALPAIGTVASVASVGGAIAAGSIIAAAPPAPLTPPEIAAPPANAPPPAIETVTVTAAPIAPISPVVPVASAGAAIGAGAVVATSTPPPIAEPAPAQPSDTIETVTVTASAPPPILPPATVVASAIPGVASIVLDTPTIEVPEPNPTYEDSQPSLTDRIKDGLTDALEQYGSDYVSQELVDYLTDLLGRPPTQQEIDDWGNWIDDGANPNSPPGSGFLGIPIWAWALFGAVFIYAAADSYGGGGRKPRR